MAKIYYISKEEADKQIALERAKLPRIRRTFMDTVLDSLVTSKSDVVAFAHASDGLHVFINGHHRGYFVRQKEQLVWKVV